MEEGAAAIPHRQGVLTLRIYHVEHVRDFARFLVVDIFQRIEAVEAGVENPRPRDLWDFVIYEKEAALGKLDVFREAYKKFVHGRAAAK